MDFKLFEKTFVSDETNEVCAFFIKRNVRVWKLDKHSKEFPKNKFSIQFEKEDKEVFFANEIELLEYEVAGKTVRQYISEMKDYNVGGLFNNDKEFPDWEKEEA